ncbi:MAG: SIS domain-containing protein [Phycisphaerales bacterium]
MAFSSLNSLREAQRVLSDLASSVAQVKLIDGAIQTLAQAYSRGNKVLAIGNGGSCCDAAHFAEELTGRFRKDRPPLAALACNDAGHITCTANDYGFDHIFSRWITAHGKAGDVVIILSTSGNSPNCVAAAKAAKAAGATTIGLLGKGGGVLKGEVDHAIVVGGETSDRIQELHMLILHIFVEGIERELGYVA